MTARLIRGRILPRDGAGETGRGEFRLGIYSSHYSRPATNFFPGAYFVVLAYRSRALSVIGTKTEGDACNYQSHKADSLLSEA